MASHPAKDNLTSLYNALAPLLAAASIGDFTGQIKLTHTDDPHVNELLMGYHVLLDVIRQQNAELAKFRRDSRDTTHRETPTLLDDILQSRD